MKPTYFGANVRIVYTPPGDLIVQRFFNVSGDWHNVATFEHNSKLPHLEARAFASTFAAILRDGEANP